MKDTQWPRYQVFLQEREDEPHQDAGSVHAPDPELALLNARDVFVRRPECVSLWVVAADEIYSRTAEELEEQGRAISGEGDVLSLPGSEGGTVDELYDVFCKTKPAGTQRMVGQVMARTLAGAMQRAVEQFNGQRTTIGEGRMPATAPFVWWVFPDRAVTRSSPQEVQSMFAPALNKPFRLSTDFRTLTAMREIQKLDPQQDADQPATSAPGGLSTTR